MYHINSHKSRQIPDCFLPPPFLVSWRKALQPEIANSNQIHNDMGVWIEPNECLPNNLNLEVRRLHAVANKHTSSCGNGDEIEVIQCMSDRKRYGYFLFTTM